MKGTWRLTEVLHPGRLPDIHGELNQCHVVAVVNIRQYTFQVLSHVFDSGLHCEKRWCRVKVHTD